ncbi:MAG: hypothetical protein PHD49_04725 [Candidatus Shapirobacteria bacterium]|nr:hypothetical protein [Candidatus Shapirobacteria bacterium]
MSLILDLIFPKKCYGCGQTGEYICSKCQKNINILNTKPPQNGFNGGLSLFKYHSFIKSAIVDLKYGFVSDNTNDLADFCVKTLKSKFPNLIKYWHQNNFVLIPIPLHQSRQNWRGFNQSDILSQKIASKLSLDFSNQILIRYQNTAVQARFKNIKDRKNNVANIFSLSPVSGKFKHQNFILFDDVCTTQSTLISAQKTLKISSPNQCWFLTLSAG